jgi:predicted transcriptional regulator
MSALPEPTPIHQDQVFDQLKNDVLAGVASIDAGRTVSAEEMRAMFGLSEPTA